MADTFFIIDIALRARCFSRSMRPRYVTMGDQQVLLSSSPLNIASSYLRSREFILDALATVPLELVGAAAGWSWMSSLRLNRILRVYRIRSWWSHVMDWLELKGLLERAPFRRMWALFMTMALASHWMACVFYLTAYERAVSGEAETWCSIDGLWEVLPSNASTGLAATAGSGGLWSVRMQEPTHIQYLRAIYWAVITMVTVRALGYTLPVATNSWVYPALHAPPLPNG